MCSFGHPIDCHLACRGIQGWPKIHLEVFAVDAANNCWPVGFGFGFVPSQPGFHTIEIPTWKVATHNLVDALKTKFNTGGYTISKSDLVYSGVDRYDLYFGCLCNSSSLMLTNLSVRYKLSTISSGCITVEFMIISKNFATFGVDLK